MILSIGCSSKTPVIQSTNLTDIDIPENVGAMVSDRLPESKGVYSIVYMTPIRLPRADDSVTICYEVVVAGSRYYGLATQLLCSRKRYENRIFYHLDTFSNKGRIVI